MLKVKNVTKKYGKLLANDNLSFEVKDGEIAILMGPNGAGKSTVIKSICGLLRYDGTIEIDGHLKGDLAAKKELGYIPETPAIYDLLTVSEHLEFICKAFKVEDNGLGESLLRRFELWDKKDKLGKELSKGMQQKLSICCALVHRPKLVIFDEPMVGLDPHAIKELKLVFRELKEQGCSLLISTHMIDSIEDFWDVVHIMVQGKIAQSISHEEGDVDVEKRFFEITEGSPEEAAR